MDEAAGTFSLAEQYLADMLADCPTFQALCGDNGFDAVDRIWFDALPDPADGEAYTVSEHQSYRPNALISTDRYTTKASGAESDGSFGTDSSIQHTITIVRSTPSGDFKEVDRSWKNVFGQIVDELNERKGLAGFLSFSTLNVIEWFRTHPRAIADEGDAQYVMIQVVTEVGST